MNVLIIPEDFRNDQFLLKPLFERLFTELGKPRTKVEVCKEPLFGGVIEALKSNRLREVVNRYRMVDIFILCVDRDGIPTRRQRLDQIEREFSAANRFLAENAWEELETWALAGVSLPPGYFWSDIRAEISVKERYFNAIAQELGFSDGPGGGRKELGREAARNVQTIRQKCPEDFGHLADRLQTLLAPRLIPLPSPQMEARMTEELIVARADSVMEIHFNRPEKKNALTRAMYDGVAAAFEEAEIDPAIRVILLTGSGDTFTSGNDIKDFQRRATTRNSPAASTFLTALSTLKKPLIAAVNGAAIGVGTTMLGHCDLIVAARSARFVMPFTRLGLVPEAGSSLLFPQLLGHQKASAMLLLGDPLDADAALAAGFVYQVVDDADLMHAARALAKRVAALPPQAVQQTKHLMRRGTPTLPDRIGEELAVFSERVASPEAAEAFTAFMEKRAPDFSRFS